MVTLCKSYSTYDLAVGGLGQGCFQFVAFQDLLFCLNFEIEIFSDTVVSTRP